MPPDHISNCFPFQQVVRAKKIHSHCKVLDELPEVEAPAEAGLVEVVPQRGQHHVHEVARRVQDGRVGEQEVHQPEVLEVEQLPLARYQAFCLD